MYKKRELTDTENQELKKLEEQIKNLFESSPILDDISSHYKIDDKYLIRLEKKDFNCNKYSINIKSRYWNAQKTFFLQKSEFADLRKFTHKLTPIENTIIKLYEKQPTKGE